MTQTQIRYQLSTRLALPAEQALPQVLAALKTEGFGVLFNLDMQAILKQKLDVDYRPYWVLGACNPPLAYKALQAESDIGLLIPCHVVVAEEDGATVVSLIDPVAVLGIVGNPDLDAIATEVRTRFQRVITALNA
ncbi:MAG: DUF302 domain-containing protein [Chloroflexi bacterium]|nr:DUF302 domain-containing protein [Chloroflexota bacterium]